MIRVLSFFLFILLITSSCTQTNNRSQHDNARPNENNDSAIDDPLPNKRFGKSEIINPKFNPKLIFGVWALSYDAPACAIEINEKRVLLCDYDGDGERLYRIVGDSIFLDNPYLIFNGKIIKVTQDTLLIHWQNNDKPETLLRWKD